MKILFATDGSRPAREGESLITDLFRREVSIHVFAVSDEGALDMLPYPAGPVAAAETTAEGMARQAVARLGAAGFLTAWSWSVGRPGQEIVDAIDREHADLVVLGASRPSWMGTFLLGSVSRHVLHHVSCPVLIAHRAPREGRVLCAVDGSEASAAATRLAATLLDPARCTIHVATVATGSWGGMHPTALTMMTGGPRSSAHHNTEEPVERGWRLVERVRKELETLGFPTVGSVLQGTPSHQLLREVGHLPIDIAVVGRRGLGPLRRTFGSVSEHLVRHAPATLVGGTTRARAERAVSAPHPAATTILEWAQATGAEG